MKNIIPVVLVLFFTACTTTYPPITEYRIEAAKQIEVVSQSSCKKHSLKVSQVFVKSALMSKKMKYVVGSYKEYAYNQSEWAEDPNKAITDAIVSDLQTAKIFDTVTSYRSFSNSEYTLESRVEDFSQYFTEDEKHAFVKLSITFSLIENKSAMVVATKKIIKEMPTKEPNAKSGVVALNQLLNECFVELNSWLAGSCQ